jgi:hypothetical protein
MGGQAIAFDLQTGAPLDDATAAQAVASGAAGFKNDAIVYMHNPNTGRDVGVSAAQAAQALASGYQLLPSEYVAQKQQAKADREEYGGFGGTLRAGVEGAARGVSFGLSDVALKEAGLGEGMAERQQYNPIASTGGEVVGTVGGLFLPGGAAAKGAGAAGKAARVATAAPRALARSAEALGAATTRKLGGGLAAKALGAGTAAATEGAAYGAAQVISQAALQDQELTAEMLLAGVLEGAAMGAVLGGGLSVTGSALGAAGRKVRDKLGGKSLREFAEQEAGVAMLGASKSELRKILNRGGEERLARLGRRGLDETALMSDPKRALGVVTREAGDAVTRLKQVQQQIDEAGTKIERAGLVQDIDARLAQSSKALLASEKRVAPAARKELRDVLGRLTDAGDELSFSEAWDIRKAIDNSPLIKWDKSIGDAPPIAKALQDIRGMVSSKLDDAADSLSPELKEAWKKANADYSDMAAMRDVLKRRTESDLAGSLISTGDTVATAAGLGLGALSGTPLTAMVAGAATGAANKLLRERGHEFLARAANRLSKSRETIDGAARKLTGSKLPMPTRLAAPAAVPLMERYDRERERTLALSRPEALQRALEASTRGLEHERGLAVAMQATLAGDAAYLQSQLPQQRPVSNLTPNAGAQPPTRSEAKAFLAKAEAIKDPSTVLTDLADGKLDPAAIEALKVRRPKIYAEMRKKVALYAAQKSEQIPYKQKVLLSLAFDFSADSSLEPATIADMQSAYTTPPVPSGVTGAQQGFAQQDAEQNQPAPARGGQGMQKSNQAMTLPSEAAAQGL